jgi:hypothetical protein
MNKAKGFLVEGFSMCCVCAEKYAHESGHPHLFFLMNPLIDMDPNKRCCCGQYPNTKEALCAGVRIAKLFERQE